MRAAALAAAAVIAVAATATDVRAAERPAVVVTSGQEQKFGIALQKFAGGPDAEVYREGLAAALPGSLSGGEGFSRWLPRGLKHGEIAPTVVN